MAGTEARPTRTEARPTIKRFYTKFSFRCNQLHG